MFRSPIQPNGCLWDANGQLVCQPPGRGGAGPRVRAADPTTVREPFAVATGGQGQAQAQAQQAGAVEALQGEDFAGSVRSMMAHKGLVQSPLTFRR